MENKEYSFEKFWNKGQRVGQAVLDLMNKPQYSVSVEELLEEMSERFVKEIEKSIEYGKNHFADPFYIVVLGKKELAQFGISNVERNWFIPRQTDPDIAKINREYANFTKTLYKVKSTGAFKLKWSIPSYQDCHTILKNPQIYDADLVKWAKMAS